MKNLQRFVQAWVMLRAMPGLVFHVHELIGEMLRQVPFAQDAGKRFMSELQALGTRLESIRADLDRDRRHRAYPVTVNIFARALLPGTPSVGPMAPNDRIAQVIGAKTVWLAPGEQTKVEFFPHYLLGSGAAVVIQGPAMLERVITGHETCSVSNDDGFGVMAMIPRSVDVGVSIVCHVIGIGPVLAKRDGG
ncbi:MAG: hypothetical protein PHX83_14650 [Acidobacteriia bacterium]|nr:hypothetical protein [Terriglobia bacterium]